MSQQMVILTSNDGESFSVELNVAKMSGTINLMLENLGVSEGKSAEDDVIPLPNVNAATLGKVLVWAEMHKDDAAPSSDFDEDVSKRTDDIPPQDVEFLKVDQGTLFNLILAANYLDMKELLDVCCKTVANMIKGKSPEDVRSMFNIVNDFTPEEEEAIRKENEWCEDRDTTAS